VRALMAKMPMGLPESPFTNMDWSPSFVAFLLYIGAVTTQRAPIGSAAMVSALVLLIFEKKKLTVPPALFWLFGLVVWSGVGLVLTSYPTQVTEAVTEFGKIALISFAMVNVITSRARLRVFLLVVTFFFFIYPLRGTLQYYFIINETMAGRAIWNHMYSNPNDLAGFCILQLSIVLGIIEVEQKKYARWFAFGCALLLPLIIVLTQSRGALIAMAVFMLIMLKKHWRETKKMVVVGFVGLGVVLIAPKSVWDRVATISNPVDEVTGEEGETDAGSSTAGRIQIWKVAGEIIRANPMGVGLGAYREAHNVQVRKKSGLNNRWMAYGKRDTHSTYLKIMAERGLPGFVLFTGLVVVIAMGAYKVRKKQAARHPALARQLFYLEIGLYGYLIAGIWGSYDQWVPTYVHLMLVLATARLLAEEGGPVGPPRRPKFIPPVAQPAPAASPMAGA
jgi:O-antigen ligase